MKSDSDLAVEIRTEIARQRGSRADDVDLQVLQGVVTLTGNLQSDLEKWNLRDAISGMPGVERVIDETMIAPEPSLRSADADAARPWFPAH
jgi:osmotically-inducible protein OsmY